MPTKPKIQIPTYPIMSIKDIQALLYAKCLRCGNTWRKRTENPKQCPNCKSTYWNKPKRKPKQ
jgi:predicted Zn-ribbon and HTH transcriptional regulator